MTHPSVGHSLEDPSDRQGESGHNSTYYPKQYIYPKQVNSTSIPNIETNTKINNQANRLIIKFRIAE